MSEWMEFLAELIDKDLQYVMESGLAAKSAYWAKAPPEGILTTYIRMIITLYQKTAHHTTSILIHTTTDPEPSCCFLDRKEFWSDFWFYEKNHNGALGMCCRHPVMSYHQCYPCSVVILCITEVLHMKY